MDVQEASAASAASSPAARLERTKRFLNWKMIAIELAIALLGFYIFNETTARKPTLPGILGVLFGVIALWLLWRELAGISIHSDLDLNADKPDPHAASPIVLSTNRLIVRRTPSDCVAAVGRI